MSEESASTVSDLAGIKPLAKSIEIVTQGAVDAATAFLGKLCMPAVKELGMLAKEKVHAWRTGNIVALAQKTEDKMKENDLPDGVHSHPRLVSLIVEQAAWSNDSIVQDLWAGLLASSCTEQGDDDSNLIFTNLLSNLTKMEARILKHACESSTKIRNHLGLIYAEQLWISTRGMIEMTGENDVQRLDRELDHLRSLSLLDHGGYTVVNKCDTLLITPTPLALHMYVRCQGSRKAPVEYFLGLILPKIVY